MQGYTMNGAIEDVSSDYIFHFDIVPMALQRSRYDSRKKGFYNPNYNLKYKKELLRQLSLQWKREPIDQAISAQFIFKFVRPKSVKRLNHVVKPDLSNLIKSVEDAFNGHLWKDDSFIYNYCNSRKEYADKPGIELHVYIG